MAQDTLPFTGRSARLDHPAAAGISGPAARGWPTAETPIALWQKASLALVVVALTVGVLLAPGAARAPLLALVALPFMGLAALRLAALKRPEFQDAPALDDDALPSYTVLVPLFREAGVLPALLGALSRLDYPRQKLDIVLILEEDDAETRAVVSAATLPPAVRAVVVPAGEPRTKPRALNHALARTDGHLVTVFDAEDEPDPDQLRKAAAVLAAGGGRLGCVQARLAVYNRGDGFLTQQFSIEYAALFDRLLPALQRLGLPIPLGGTSNHFPRDVLEVMGGWDAHNVTEDADLGMRLARAGYEVAVLDSDTWEEAVPTWRGWQGQRTRWLKGWMQTWAVHMSDPRKLWHDLGVWRFLGFQLMIGGLIVSALVHPWFYVLLVATAWQGALLPASGDVVGWLMFSVAAVGIAIGYLAPMLLGYVAVKDRGWRDLMRAVAGMPLYWLAVSWAAHKALRELARDPFHWEKTEHSARPLR